MDILVLSVSNAVRGPMAEALLARALGPDHRVRSCGHRGLPLHPLAVKALQEVGVDLSGHVPKALRELDTLEVELSINLCFGEPGPMLAGRLKRLDWPTPDPLKGPAGEEALLQRLRQTRDLLQARVDKFAPTLTLAVPA